MSNLVSVWHTIIWQDIHAIYSKKIKKITIGLLL